MLKARGLFETTPEQEDMLVRDIEPEEEIAPPDADDLKFMKFWKSFATSVKSQAITGSHVLPSTAYGFVTLCLASVPLWISVLGRSLTMNS
ncbi:hypothetical protein [Paraflavitalea speifideaquila]|uniref:hypothetical protein n=1 Tax=Paraflavitalea speifideaquila TaxID=3076558 RepID=UPI0028ED873A|nr:hypothetical protein [Paraflavitalea speifideiaquila]